jgi:hypothetical protein
VHYAAILLARIDVHHRGGRKPPQFTGFIPEGQGTPRLAMIRDADRDDPLELDGRGLGCGFPPAGD